MAVPVESRYLKRPDTVQALYTAEMMAQVGMREDQEELLGIWVRLGTKVQEELYMFGKEEAEEGEEEEVVVEEEEEEEGVQRRVKELDRKEELHKTKDQQQTRRRKVRRGSHPSCLT
ncbi:unnamed protein product [Haemonchus placei]|uniref:Uncharacterized protein n=1 Tax=Haemonchus placei TaxID=6290 RepID=A0A3P7TQN3_HAEPC|nr:unnamed protein product [Haemonchus placei]